MRSSKMAAGSGRAAILRRRLTGVENLTLYYYQVSNKGRSDLMEPIEQMQYIP